MVSDVAGSVLGFVLIFLGLVVSWGFVVLCAALVIVPVWLLVDGVTKGGGE